MINSDPEVLSDAVRDACEAVLETDALFLSVHVTVFVEWVEGETDGDEDTDEEPESLAAEDSDAIELTVTSFVRVTR